MKIVSGMPRKWILRPAFVLGMLRTCSAFIGLDLSADFWISLSKWDRLES